jgi:hypothetical protein
MATKIPPCNSHNGKHKWEWQYDKTFHKKVGFVVTQSRRGLFYCPWCGERRWGKARSNL